MKKNRTYHPRNKPVDGFKVNTHPLYKIWAMMLGRCTNETVTVFANYGGRGITVCERWHHFENFAEDMYPTYSKEFTLDRINNDLGYCPENCAWRSRTDQCVNRRRFKNNTSGYTGIKRQNNTWIAAFDYENTRYNIGWFKSKQEAVIARETFIDLFFENRDIALTTLPENQARWNSSTGIRGITPHLDGGFTVRITVNKKRIYLGYFKTLPEAVDARIRFLEG